MAHNERATTLRKVSRHLAVRGSMVGVALFGSTATEAQATPHKLPGLYAHAQEARYFGPSATRAGTQGVSELACQQALKGGSVKIRPAKNPGTLRFDISYAPYPEECMHPEGPDGKLAVKGLTTEVFKVRKHHEDKGKLLARVDVLGNGDDQGVRVRTRYHVEDYDFCADPSAQYAVTIKTGEEPQLIDPSFAEDIFAHPKGEVTNIHLINDRRHYDISDAEVFKPEC